MIATLTRYYTPFCVLGGLDIAGKSFVTVERPWKGNKPFESCIPEGLYDCKRYSSTKYPDTFEITGVPGRTKILFHKGNSAADVEGCIAVGTSFDFSGYRIVDSASAFHEMMDHLRPYKEFQIDIVPFTVEYP